MKALDFLKTLKEKQNNSKSKGGKFIPKENFLWYLLREELGDVKATIYFRPYKIEDAIYYYAKRNPKGYLQPISKEEYDEIWRKIDKEKKVNGKQITQSPSIRFVMQIIVPAEINGLKGEDRLLVHECSKTEFARIVDLQDKTLEGNYAEYFEEMEKTPEEMGILIKRYYTKEDKVPSFEYVIKATAKGVKPVIYEGDLTAFEKDEFNLPKYYVVNKNETNVIDIAETI